MEGSVSGLARPGSTTSTTKRAVASQEKAENQIYAEIAELLSKMFGGGKVIPLVVSGLGLGLKDVLEKVMDKDGVLRPNKSDWIFRNILKRVLSSLLFGSVGYSGEMGDKFIDFLFGNQDGELDKKDGITLAGLLTRLRNYYPYITTLAASDNGSVWSLIKGEFSYTDFEKMGKGIEELDYNKIDKGLISAAYKGYVASRVSDRKTSADIDRELAEKLGNPPNFNKIKRELAALLACAAHDAINYYYTQHNDDGLKYDIDLSKVLDKDNFLEKYAVVATRLLSKQKDDKIFAMPEVLNREAVEKLYLLHKKTLQDEKAQAAQKQGPRKPAPDNSP